MKGKFIATQRFFFSLLAPENKSFISPESENEVNWNYFFRQAQIHRLVPLLYYRLHQLKIKIPLSLEEKLKKISTQNLAKNLILQKELEEVLKKLKAEKIEVIVLKGLFLAHSIYPHLGLRYLGDIDLLVREKDLSAVQDILRRLNYQISGPHQLGFYRFYHRHFHLMKTLPNQKKILLELHWQIKRESDPFKIEIEKWWERREKFSLYPDLAFSLSPEDTLLYLALHLYQHSFTAFCFLVDLAYFLKKFHQELDWSVLAKRAQSCRLKTIVYFSLFLCQKYLKIFEEKEPNLLLKFSPNLFHQKIIKPLLLSQAKLSSFEGKNFFKNLKDACIQFILLRFLTMDSFTQVTRYFLRKIFPPLIEIKLRYRLSSPYKILLFYLLHPFFLLAKLKRSQFIKQR
jgi:hypothetical protein